MPYKTKEQRKEQARLRRVAGLCATGPKPTLRRRILCGAANIVEKVDSEIGLNIGMKTGG